MKRLSEHPLLTRLLRDEDGSETLEYAVVTSLVVMLAISVIKSIGTKVLGKWQSLNSSM